MSPHLRDTGDITGEIFVLISCWPGGRDVWMVTCCELDVTAHSRCGVVEEGQQSIHYYLEIICYLMAIRNYANTFVKSDKLLNISQNTYIY